jgi:hypothetical protein
MLVEGLVVGGGDEVVDVEGFAGGAGLVGGGPMEERRDGGDESGASGGVSTEL